MRARGAMVTDIAILVVAADDGIMPQTVESINHAKAAEIPIIVAINKMDKPTANPERVMQQLTEYGLVHRGVGRRRPLCAPSPPRPAWASTTCWRRIALEAEVMELKANPNRACQGRRYRGPSGQGPGPRGHHCWCRTAPCTQGDVIIAGTAVGRVRAMLQRQGQPLNDAGPSVPVEITGLTEVPAAGAPVQRRRADERLARELVEQRKRRQGEARPPPSSEGHSGEPVQPDQAQDEMKELAIDRQG